MATARLIRTITVPRLPGRSNADLARLMDSYRVADARKLLGKAASPDVVVVAGGTEEARAVRKAMRDLGLGSTPLLSWDTILDGSGLDDSSYLQRTHIGPGSVRSRPTMPPLPTRAPRSSSRRSRRRRRAALRPIS